MIARARGKPRDFGLNLFFAGARAPKRRCRPVGFRGTPFEPVLSGRPVPVDDAVEDRARFRYLGCSAGLSIRNRHTRPEDVQLPSKRIGHIHVATGRHRDTVRFREPVRRRARDPANPFPCQVELADHMTFALGDVQDASFDRKRSHIAFFAFRAAKGSIRTARPSQLSFEHARRAERGDQALAAVGDIHTPARRVHSNGVRFFELHALQRRKESGFFVFFRTSRPRLEDVHDPVRRVRHIQVAR
jgi:hypothetical protein